jgi:ribosomal protein S18 acetylase RimI-like enzyme
MNNLKSNIKSIEEKDLEDLKKVLDSIELFPSTFLEEMIHDFLYNNDSHDLWFTYIENGTPISIGYCSPEKFTNGTYNLLALGVSKNNQRKGIAIEMINYIENILRQRNARILIVETSSDFAQLGAQKLYSKLGYTKEAVLREFWNEGEDKVIYSKKLR